MHHVKVIRSIPVIVGNGAPTFATAGEWKTIDEDDEELIQESCLFLTDDVQEVYDSRVSSRFATTSPLLRCSNRPPSVSLELLLRAVGPEHPHFLQHGAIFCPLKHGINTVF